MKITECVGRLFSCMEIKNVMINFSEAKDMTHHFPYLNFHKKLLSTYFALSIL